MLYLNIYRIFAKENKEVMVNSNKDKDKVVIATGNKKENAGGDNGIYGSYLLLKKNYNKKETIIIYNIILLYIIYYIIYTILYNILYIELFIYLYLYKYINKLYI